MSSGKVSAIALVLLVTTGCATNRVQRLKAECDQRNASSCVEPATALRDSGDAPGELRAADAACRAHHAFSCRRVGDLLSAAPEGVALDESTALTRYVRACSLGDSGGCLEAAVMFQMGRGARRDYGRAKELFLEGCRKAQVEKCDGAAGVARLYELERQIASNPPSPPCSDPKGRGLAREVIVEVIEAHQNEIEYCYERQLWRRNAEGMIFVKFAITADGTVSSTSISEDSVGSARLTSCLTEQLRSWRFPSPKCGGLVTVNFPWIFKMEEPTP